MVSALATVDTTKGDSADQPNKRAMRDFKRKMRSGTEPKTTKDAAVTRPFVAELF
jgi:hypothetical protein